MYKFNFYHTRPENFFRNNKAEQTKGLVGYLMSRIKNLNLSQTDMSEKTLFAEPSSLQKIQEKICMHP